MRLCDRDIEAYLNSGKLKISPQPALSCINCATVDFRLCNQYSNFK